jgi:hypothetical protein
MRAVAVAYLLAGGFLVFPTSLPILPFEQVLVFTEKINFLFPPIKEANGMTLDAAPLLAGRLGWDGVVQDVARVYADLPAEERTVAGIYTDWYPAAGAIDTLGPRYSIPHAVSGSLTYYFWGPGYSWDVMILLTSKTNPMAVFFDKCELKTVVQNDTNPFLLTRHIFVCRQPKVSAETIWSGAKLFR